MKLIIINGPNLNLLGKRKLRYMEISLLRIILRLKSKYEDIELEYYQSNIEGEY